MRAISYKKMFGAYEISDITEGEGTEITIKFEEAFDGILVLGCSEFNVSHGICKARSDKLKDGEYQPKLYTGSGCQKIESFTVKNGAIIRHNPDTDYIRRLAREVSELSERVLELEIADIEIKGRISQTLDF